MRKVQGMCSAHFVTTAYIVSYRAQCHHLWQNLSYGIFDVVDRSAVPFDSGLVAWGNPAFGGDLGAMQPLLMSATELRIYGAFEG